MLPQTTIRANNSGSVSTECPQATRFENAASLLDGPFLEQARLENAGADEPAAEYFAPRRVPESLALAAEARYFGMTSHDVPRTRRAKMKLLEAWMVIHHEDLRANWELLSRGEQFFRIDPLK